MSGLQSVACLVCKATHLVAGCCLSTGPWAVVVFAASHRVPAGGGGGVGDLAEDKINVDKFGSSFVPNISSNFKDAMRQNVGTGHGLQGGGGFLRAACSVNAQPRDETRC